MTRQLILCADDFALSPAISRAIAGLAEDDRINAVSCMAAMPDWVEDSRRLRSLPERIAVGLHVVLTDVTGVCGRAMPTIGQLTRASLSRRIDTAAVRAEIEAQFERFSDSMGRAPDFVDGHQHCHHLPRIRGTVLELTAKYAPDAWLRDCSERVTAMLARPFAGKALRSAALSAGFAKAAAAFGLRVNEGFAGHYGFRQPYAELFKRFLVQPGPRHLVMCHPGGGYLPGDTISAARRAEWQVLSELPVRELAEAAGLSFDSRFTSVQA